MTSSPTQFAAYVYPGWHASSYRPGLDEWALLDRFQPYFPGHAAPPRPLAGRYDDSRRETAAQQIAVALQYGISAFTYFAYFRPGGFVMKRPIDAAFAAAAPDRRMQLSLTLCLRLPHQVLPLPISYDHWRFVEAPRGRARKSSAPVTAASRTDMARLVELLSAAEGSEVPIEHLHVLQRDRETFEGDSSPDQRRTLFTVDSAIELFERWAREYASQGTYWCIDGRPVCSLLNIGDFCSSYSIDGFRLILRICRGVFRRELGVDPFIIGVIGEATRANATLASKLPLDGVTGYGLLPEWIGAPIQSYPELIERRVREWARFQDEIGPIPFLPVACCGWDATVRGEWSEDLRTRQGFPWRPVIEGVTPRLFEEFVARAVDFNRKRHPHVNVVFLHAWNEWTESAALEPSDRFGYELLRAVAAAKNRSV